MEPSAERIEIKEQFGSEDHPSLNKQFLLNRLSHMSSEIELMKKSIQNEEKNEAEEKHEGQGSENEGRQNQNDILRDSPFLFKQTREKKVKKLKNIVRNMKIKNLVKNYAKKISLNNVEREPVEFTPFHFEQEEDQCSGIEVPNKFLNFMYFISILNTLAFCIIATLSIVFEDIVVSKDVTIFQIMGGFWLLLEIIINFTRISYGKSDSKLEKLKEIALYYFKSRFGIDVICLGAIIIDLIVTSKATIFLRLLFFLKIPDFLEKIQNLETKALDTVHKENYWALIKVFLTNFLFAHFLAIILVMVTWLNSQQNWLMKVNALEAAWYEKYSWAYYWGTTIMLTVGFGDIAVVNYKEALCLTMIEAISCIALAYNINCVGNLISNIRAEGIQKVKKQKILKHLSEKNDISQDLTMKISNYIEECSNIKKKFSIEEDSAFVSSLPSAIKTSFLRESNKKIFDKLPFFKNLTESAMLNLAERIEMCITHPDQIIAKKDDKPSILILKQGCVAFCPKISGSKFNNQVIDKLEVKEKQIPLLLSFEFISPIKAKNYQVISKQYSILYTMQVQVLKEILKEKEKDLEYFFYLKDKSKHVIDELQFKDCEFCKSKHLKFNCPKLHYVPITQQIIFKHLHYSKKGKNQRTKFTRQKKIGTAFSSHMSEKEIISSFSSFSSLKEETERKKMDEADYFTAEEIMNAISGEFSCENKELKRINECGKKIAENKVVEETIEKMKNQMMYYLHEEHSWFWMIETDIMKDYQFYFCKENSKNLEEKYPGKIYQRRILFD